MKVMLLFATLALCACSPVLADNPKVINLSKTEKAKAMALLERRQAISLLRQKITAQYQADMDRMNEDDNAVNIDATKLCFELKKAHTIPPNTNYALDEVNARLVKQ